jgi:nitrate/TMAO reductase-like tetraheme cytochrome c subunit
MRLLSWIVKPAVLAAVGGLVVGGLLAVPVADGIDRYFSSNDFCANTCHVMTATVAEEFNESAHGTTATGVRPQCRDCHVSEGLTAAMWDHVVGTGELVAFVFGGVNTVEAFEAERAAAADRVRFSMLANDSSHCRSCHVMAAIQPARKRGQRQHQEAREKGITCIVCHYNLVHKEVEPSEAFDKVIGSY